MNSCKVSTVTDPIVEVADLTKRFSGTVANDGVDLSVAEGTFYGIIGPNGSGKTTLFNVVTGFLEPDSGRVRFDGRDITGLPPNRIAREGLVRTFQVPTPFESLTVRENLLAAYSGGLASGLRVRPAQKERAEELLDLLDLAGVAGENAGEISGGQQKLLELGRAMMQEPQCLLLDEPTASVNPALQERLLEFLAEVNDRGTTIVLIEHDMDVIADTCDQLAVLDRGRIVTEGTFSEVTDHPEVRTAYLGAGTEDAGSAGYDSANDPLDSQADTPGGRTEGGPVEQPGDGGLVGSGGESTVQGSEADPDELVATGLVSGYGSHRILDGVSLRSHDGVTCVFGPNGSGKSTLLKALGGVIPAWEGTIEFGDRDITEFESHECIAAGISMVPQEDMIFEGLTVRENLQIAVETLPGTVPAEERIENVLRAFPPLESCMDTRAGSLSGGQQTMLGFGRAMTADSDVYLLDEPTSSLAPSVTEDILGMVETLVDQDARVVLVEQNVSEALTLADHVYILAQGRLQFDGPPAELRDETDLLETYLGMG
jgi:ABC-type branched-subunit amino acid transport system ATPase component